LRLIVLEANMRGIKSFRAYSRKYIKYMQVAFFYQLSTFLPSFFFHCGECCRHGEVLQTTLTVQLPAKALRVNFGGAKR
jgi:hypothetical protein